jgi:hypothetical protein
LRGKGVLWKYGANKTIGVFHYLVIVSVSSSGVDKHKVLAFALLCHEANYLTLSASGCIILCMRGISLSSIIHFATMRRLEARKWAAARHRLLDFSQSLWSFQEATMKYHIHRGICLTLLALAFLFPFRAWSAQCYIKKACFAVAEPNLEERVCYLFRHDKRMYKPGQESEFVQVTGAPELHPDPLHVDFMELSLDKRYLGLKPGTYVFSCKYDIETLRSDPTSSALAYGRPPEFYCSGTMYHFVPVRIMNMNTCYWVAVESITCDDSPPSPASFQQGAANINE